MLSGRRTKFLTHPPLPLGVLRSLATAMWLVQAFFKNSTVAFFHSRLAIDTASSLHWCGPLFPMIIASDCDCRCHVHFLCARVSPEGTLWCEGGVHDTLLVVLLMPCAFFYVRVFPEGTLWCEGGVHDTGHVPCLFCPCVGSSPTLHSYGSYIGISCQCQRHFQLSSFPIDRTCAGAYSFGIGAAGVGGRTRGSIT